jgi:hypothetical protein
LSGRTLRPCDSGTLNEAAIAADADALEKMPPSLMNTIIVPVTPNE